MFTPKYEPKAGGSPGRISYRALAGEGSPVFRDVGNTGTVFVD